MRACERVCMCARADTKLKFGRACIHAHVHRARVRACVLACVWEKDGEGGEREEWEEGRDRVCVCVCAHKNVLELLGVSSEIDG